MIFPLECLTNNLTVVSELPLTSTQTDSDQNSNSNHVSKSSLCTASSFPEKIGQSFFRGGGGCAQARASEVK